jgi:HEPN domain-containing protein
MGQRSRRKRWISYRHVFLAQQVGEKALKAFLYAKGEEIVLGNSIERLCNLCSKYNAEFSERVKLLDAHYLTSSPP